jgi:hypothetical protein
VITSGVALVVWASQAASPVAPKSNSQRGLKAVSGGWGFRPAKQHHPGRPRVLLIGDSICSQYSRPVIARLGERADVDVWVTPKNLASKELAEQLRAVLAQGPYDVIHFNIGLHGWPAGRIPQGQYRPLLERYVGIYQERAPEATLIWASTTTIGLSKAQPDQLDPVNNPTIIRRNRMAAEVMRARGIGINDLYALADRHGDLKRDRFHWNQRGVELLADAVAARIKEALEIRSKATRLSPRNQDGEGNASREKKHSTSLPRRLHFATRS